MRMGFALGSNLGDRLHNLRAARRLLIEDFFAPALSAPLYETVPVDCPPEAGCFYNTVVELEVDVLSKEFLEILDVIQSIERTLGRHQGRGHHAPREVDVDLLYAGDLALQLPGLIVPHPRLHERRFVLEPLAWLYPKLRLPGFERTIAELLIALPAAEPPLSLVQETW